MNRSGIHVPQMLLPVMLTTFLLGAGCMSMPRSIVPAHAHPVVGTWEFVDEGEVRRVEFTRDGKCITYRGRPAVDKDKKPIEYDDNGEAVMVCDFYTVSPRKVIVLKIDRRKQKLPYEVLADGRLSVEERHIAKRVK